MSSILSGTDGISDIDGTAATPAIRGTDANTGIFFGTDIIGFSEGGVEAARINADSQFVAAAGTAALPVITTTGDLNTGIFFPAADTIAFSEGGAEAMRIDSSGNVGIGTTSPSTLKLTVEGSGSQIRVRNTTTRYRSDYAVDSAGTSSLATFDDTGAVFKQMNVYASPLTFNTTSAGAETMRIDSSGNVGVGTASPGVFGVSSKNITVANSSGYSFLQLQGSSGNGGAIDFGDTSVRHAEIASLSGSALAFYTNGSNSGNTLTERMRIDSSGNLMVGTTSSLNGNTSYSFQNNSTTLNTAWFQNANASTGTSVLVATAARTASSAFTFIDCGANFPTSFTRQFLVRGDGVIFAQNTTVQSLSDIRTKENVRDSEDGLQIIMGVRPVRFDFKEGFGNERKNVLGFVAQEIETVFPDAVDISFVDPDGEGPEDPYKSVGPAALIPVLVKAIQEQQALIQSLTTRITALETP